MGGASQLCLEGEETHKSPVVSLIWGYGGQQICGEADEPRGLRSSLGKNKVFLLVKECNFSGVYNVPKF